MHCGAIFSGSWDGLVVSKDGCCVNCVCVGVGVSFACFDSNMLQGVSMVRLCVVVV